MDQPVIGVTADDLTGASDTAAALSRPGAPVAVSLDARPRGYAGRRAFAVTTHTRACPPDVVYESVRGSVDALRAAGATLIYGKVDSNLRGNVGTQLAAALDAMGGPVLFAPAFPARERTTVGGICLVCDVPVAETEMAQDPEAPATESDVVRLLRAQRADLEVFLCPLPVVRAGARAIGASIPERGVLVLDAETDDDLDAIAEVALSLDRRPLLAGSAGLAAAVARRLSGPATSPRWPDEQYGPTFAVLASSSDVLSFQIGAAVEAGFATVPFPCGDLTREDQPLPQLEEAIEAAESALAGGRDTIVHATGPLPVAERPVELVVEHLAHLAYVVTRAVSPHAILVGGGATAQGVLEAIGAEAIDVDDEPLPGIAAGVIVGGDLAGLPIVLKPGAAGEERAVVHLIGYLNRRPAARVAQ